MVMVMISYHKQIWPFPLTKVSKFISDNMKPYPISFYALHQKSIHMPWENINSQMHKTYHITIFFPVPTSEKVHDSIRNRLPTKLPTKNLKLKWHLQKRWNFQNRMTSLLPLHLLIYFSEEFGPFFFPKVTTAVTNRRLYCIRLWARPLGFFFLSCLATLGVCPLTFPARAREPWTLLIAIQQFQWLNTGSISFN